MSWGVEPAFQHSHSFACGSAIKGKPYGETRIGVGVHTAGDCARYRTTALDALTHDVGRHRTTQRHRTMSYDVVRSVNTAEGMLLCLGGYLLWHTNKADTLEAGKALLRGALTGGSAYRAFQTMLKMQGVSPALVENVADWLPRAAYTTLLYCPTSGPVLTARFCANILRYRWLAQRCWKIACSRNRGPDRVVRNHRVDCCTNGSALTIGSVAQSIVSAKVTVDITALSIKGGPGTLVIGALGEVGWQWNGLDSSWGCLYAGVVLTGTHISLDQNESQGRVCEWKGRGLHNLVEPPLLSKKPAGRRTCRPHSDTFLSIH